jgi:hypothetical protein
MVGKTAFMSKKLKNLILSFFDTILFLDFFVKLFCFLIISFYI